MPQSKRSQAKSPGKRSKGKRRAAASPSRRPTIGMMAHELGPPPSWWDGALAAARAHQINLIVFPSDYVWRGASPRQLLHRLVGSERLDGLVLTQWWPNQETFETYYEQYYKPLPVVNFQRWYEGVPGTMANNYQGMQDLLLHLIDQHDARRIAFIQGTEGTPSADDRYRAYVDVLSEQGIELDPALVYRGDFSVFSGDAAVSVLMDERGLQPGKDFDAIAAANDMMALGAMTTLQQRGFRIPYDLAIVGFDNRTEARTALPPLTTATLPNYEMGYKATEMALALVEGEQVPDQVSVPSEMILGRSCGCSSTMVRAVAAGETVALQGGEGETSEPDAFEACVATRRDAICTVVTNSVGTIAKDMRKGWAGDLLGAFMDNICRESERKDNAFMTMFYGVLRELHVLDFKIVNAHNMISLLRRQVMLCMPAALVCRAEDLFQKARVLIQEVDEQLQVDVCSSQLANADALREVGLALLGTYTLELQMQLLPQELEKLGVSVCYLSLYVDPSKPEDEAKLVLAYDERGHLDLTDKECIFPARQLVPDFVWLEDRARCLIIEPLFFQDLSLGFVLFGAGPEDERLYGTLSRQISVALQGALLNQERAQLVDELRYRAVQFQTAAEVARASSSVLDLDTLLPQAAGLVSERFNLHYVGLFLVDAKQNQVVLRAAAGDAGEELLAQAYAVPLDKKSWIGRCVSTGKSHVALDITKKEHKVESSLLPDSRSELLLPLISRGGTLGVLTIQSERPNAFSTGEITVLQTMADQLANAIANAQLYGALIHEQSLMNSLMNNVPDQIYFKDLQSRFMRISRSQLERFRVEHEDDVIGKTDFDFFTEEHARPAYEAEQEIIRTEEPILRIEERETWPDRPDTWVLTDKLPLYDEHGKPSGTFGISRDITELKVIQTRLAEERNLLRAVLDTLPDGLSVKDFEGHYRVVNMALARSFGVESPEDMLGKTYFDFFPEDIARQLLAEAREVLESGEPIYDRESFAPGEDGGHWRSFTKVPFRDLSGNLVGYVTLNRDVTDLKNTEAALERRNLLLQTSTEISHLADVYLSQDTLFPQVVDLLCERLGMYFVGIFVVDGARIELRAGTGDIGVQLLAQKYHLRLGDLVPSAQAIAKLESHLVNDIDPELQRRALPLLPETRSELALPLVTRGTAVGALTLQSAQQDAFSPEDVVVLRTVADQLSSAIENLRLLKQTQSTLEEMQATQRRYQQRAWTAYMDMAQVTHYETQSEGRPLAEEVLLSEATKVLDQQNMLASSATDEDHAALVVPITLRDQVIGVLGIHDDDQEREWTSDDIALVEAVAERMGQAIETLRLLDETQRSAARDRLTSSVANQMRASLDVETVLQTAVRAIGESMGLHDLTIELQSREND